MSKKQIFMTCGHTANSKIWYNNEQHPYCAICGCSTTLNDFNKVDFTKRKMKCSQCGLTRTSIPTEAFFKYQPDKEYDSFYCGCDGWD